jgi:two-component system sensor histidine kinase and response regulator WspE
LPLTLSVLSVLLVEISGDPYAFPLARIDRVLRIEKEQIQSLENRQYFKLDGANIGLVQAQQVLDIELQSTATAELPVIVIGARTERYGLAVDRVLGERQVVVRPLDPRLGKVPNISAASLMDDGSPLLIVDVEDLVHSINRLLTGGVRVDRIASQASAKKEVRKRVLIVDDSLTVREVERKLLANRGYDVAVAVDGAEGWNTVRSGRFDLIISDIDMPRMNGIELVTRIRADARFKNIPIMIVSYKEREEDRLKGMEAGANYYLTKSSFHDESLLEAVVELIGEPQ